MRTLLRGDPAANYDGISEIGGPGVLRATVGSAITVARWGSLGFGLVAIAPTRTNSGWTDVILLGMCVFLTTLRTIMPLQLGDRRRFHVLVPLFDVAVFSMAVGWTGATESPWILCLMTAVAVASYGWGRATALSSGALAVVTVSVFFAVAGENLANVFDDSNDLLAVVGLALAASGGLFVRRRAIDAERQVRATGGELARLRAANDLLGDLTDVALTLPGAFTLREALERTRKLLGTYLGPRTVALLTLDEHNDEWTPKITDNCAMSATYRDGDLPGPLAHVLDSDEGLQVRSDGPDRDWISKGSHSGTYMVLRARDRVVGVLAMEHPDPTHFDDVDPVLRDGLVDVIALTIDNARWFGRLRSLGAEEERVRVARDIHDRLGQWMTYMKLELERLSAADQVDHDEVVRLHDDAAQALDELRETLRQLRSGVSDDRPLAVLGGDLVAHFAERSDVAARFRVPHPDQRLPVPVENELLRILQEALNNVDRHAKADHVDVDWIVEGGNFELTVTDDGRGFDPGRTVHERSYGVVGMRERAEVIGASFDINSTPGVGTRLTVSAGTIGKDRELPNTGEPI